jgi:hypothetical protein
VVTYRLVICRRWVNGLSVHLAISFSERLGTQKKELKMTKVLKTEKRKCLKKEKVDE